MDDLARLAAELRRELGDPPEVLPGAIPLPALPPTAFPRTDAPWHRHPRALPLAALLAASVVGLALLWGLSWRAPWRASDDWPGTVWLASETMQGPYRLADGSSIELANGARGRLSATAERAHFDLHAGRATFDVVHRPERRWVVAAGDVEVLVLGTRFSVALGPEDGVEVQVERGVVAVRAPGRDAPLQLAVGERLRRVGARITIERVDAAAAEGPPPAAAPGVASTTPEAASATSASASVAAPDWRELYRARRYPQALARAKALGFERLMREADAQLLAELADVARLGGEPALAVSCLLALERRFPAAPQATTARFLLGRIYAVQGNGTAAIAAFEEYLRRSPGGSYSSEALGRLMELYSAQGDKARAAAVARRYLERSPEGPYRKLARSLVDGR